MSAWGSLSSRNFHAAYPFFEGDRQCIIDEYGLFNDERAKLEATALLFAEYADAETGESTDDHPAVAAADKIIAEIGQQISVLDVRTLVGGYELDTAAMPDEQQIRIETAANKRTNEIEAAHEAAKAKEKAGAE